MCLKSARKCVAISSKYYGGPEGTSLPNKNVTISLKLCHPSLKNIVVFCVNERLFSTHRRYLKRKSKRWRRPKQSDARQEAN